jgi:uncharacterized protein (TIGR00369 family)
VTDDSPDDPPTDAGRPAPTGEFFEDGTFNDWLGLQVEEFGEGRVVLAVDYETFKSNPGDVMHGGVTATLIDVAGGMAIGSTEEGADSFRATTNLTVNYLRPITDTAVATAEVVRIGSTNAVSEVEVYSQAPSGEEKQVAIGTVTYQHD